MIVYAQGILSLCLLNDACGSDIYEKTIAKKSVPW